MRKIKCLLAAGLAVLLLAGCGNRQKDENVLILSCNENSPYVAEINGKFYFENYYGDIYCWDREKVYMVRECGAEEFISYLYAWNDDLYYLKNVPTEKSKWELCLYAYAPKDGTETEVLFLDRERYPCFYWMLDDTFYWWDSNYSTLYDQDIRLHRYNLSSGESGSFPLENRPMYAADAFVWQDKIYTMVQTSGTEYHLAGIDLQNGQWTDFQSGILRPRGIRGGMLIGPDCEPGEEALVNRSLDVESGEKTDWDDVSADVCSLLSINEEAAFFLGYSGEKYEQYRDYYTLIDGEPVCAASFPMKNSAVGGALLDVAAYQYGDTLFFRGDKLPENDYVDISPEIPYNEEYMDFTVYQYALKADGTLYLLVREQQRWPYA